jgi:hypothetical protein
VTRTLALAVISAEPPAAAAGAGDLAGLRRRLSGATAREAVALDFLEDDLREAERALGAVARWLEAVKDALHDARADRERLAAVAAHDPSPHADDLEGALANVRRRAAQVAAGLGATGCRPQS